MEGSALPIWLALVAHAGDLAAHHSVTPLDGYDWDKHKNFDLPFTIAIVFHYSRTFNCKVIKEKTKKLKRGATTLP